MELLENGMWNKEKPIRIAERFKFFKRDQLKEETIAIYLDELKKLVTTCEFSAYLEEALCDRFVCGIQDEIIQADLLTKHDLTLDEAYQYALTMEVPGSTEEMKPFLKKHKVEEDEVSNFEDFGKCHYDLDIKEELQTSDLQEEFEVQQEFVDLQSKSKLLSEAECDQQLLQLTNYDGKKKFVCDLCQKTFPRHSRLMDHRRTHTGEKPFICITCNKGFSRKQTLHRHRQKLSECADFETQKLIVRKQILADRIKVEYICFMCNRAFLRKATLKQHFKTHTDEKPYVCAVCKKGFTRISSLKRHLPVHGFEDALEKKTLQCQTCKQTFLKQIDLDQHLKSHTGNGNPNEKINLLDQENLKTEVIDASTNGSDETEPLEKLASLPKKLRKKNKSFLCHMCDYRTYKNYILERHLKRHTGERPFPCDMCSYKAVCKTHLTVHKRVHSTEKLFICEICGYKTNYSDKLLVHKRIHTGEKPFHCKFCDYKCAERNSLRNHERIHTGEKPFSCNFCDYRAAQKTGLVYHLKTHKKEKASVTEKRTETDEKN